MLTDAQIERYSRHIILKEVGGKGQQKLLNGRVLIIGAGALGSPAALYLAAAGVGTIGIADDDVVEISNLQRQIIHHTGDVGKAKVLSACEKMTAMNPDVEVITHQTRVRADNITEIISSYDFVIDGTDNFAAKFLINDACVLAGKPFSHGGILQFLGQTITVNPGVSACYRCLFPTPPPPGVIPTCAEAGVIGVLPGVIGTLQANEAIKHLLGKGTLLNNQMLIFDALENEFTKVEVAKNPDCPVCGAAPTITELRDELQIMKACEMERSA
ncbi:MAG TPA: adenylyltransferase [Geobacter sp.]|nr:adenylyltransferase [Geobacter sp.]